MIRNWSSMLLEDAKIFSSLKENPGQTFSLLQLDMSVKKKHFPQITPFFYEINGIRWSVSPSGEVKAKNIGKAYANLYAEDDLYWQVQSFQDSCFYSELGLFPSVFFMKERYLNMMSPEGYPWNDDERQLLKKQTSFLRILEDDQEIVFLHSSSLIQTPENIYALKTGLNEDAPLQYHLSSEYLLEQYTGENQYFLWFHWDGGKYIIHKIMDGQDINEDDTLSFPPEVIQYMAETKNAEWAKQKWEQGLWRADYVTDLKSDCFGWHDKYTIQEEKIIHQRLFLQDKMEEYWKEIMEEMNLPAEMPDEDNRFHFYAGQWELSYHPYFHPGWISYIKKLDYLHFNEKGYFPLRFPVYVQKFDNLKSFLQEFYLVFSKKLIQKDCIDFSFRLIMNESQ